MCMPRFDWGCLLETQREASEDYWSEELNSYYRVSEEAATLI